MIAGRTALLLSLLANTPGAGSEPDGGAGHLTIQSTVKDILGHPSFAGFGRLILPWDDRAYDENLPLTRIASLLPYHTHVDPETVVNALNRMIEDAASGRKVVYSFYSEAQARQEPARRRTGLFILRGSPGAPFAVICPGGGFSYVGSVHEGFPYAEAIRRKGYTTFVLRYRVGQGGAVATEDLAAAVSYIFKNAAELQVATSGYSLWAVRRGRGWQPPSVRTGWRSMEAATFPNRRPL